MLDLELSNGVTGSMFQVVVVAVAVVVACAHGVVSFPCFDALAR